MVCLKHYTCDCEKLAEKDERIAEIDAEVERLNGVARNLRRAYRDLRTLAQWIGDKYDGHKFPDAVARLVLRVYPELPSEDEIAALLAEQPEAVR